MSILKNKIIQEKDYRYIASIPFYSNENQHLFFVMIYFLEASEKTRALFSIKKINPQKDTLILSPINTANSFHNEEILWIAPFSPVHHLDSIIARDEQAHERYRLSSERLSKSVELDAHLDSLVQKYDSIINTLEPN